MSAKRYARSLMLFAAMLVLAALAPPAAWAAQPDAKASAEAATPSSLPRLNLIDRQVMLAEMMAKGLCFIDLRVDKKLHRNQMSVAQFVFHSTLDNLNDGNVGLDLAPEKHPELKETIGGIRQAWVKYAEPLNSWTGGRWGKKQFALKVYEVDEDYTKQLDKAIDHYRDVLVANGTVSETAATTILAAGKQRTLSQKLAKLFCQSLSGYKPEETPQRLKATLAKFKDVTEKFANGDKQVGLEGEQPGLVIDTIETSREWLARIEPIIDAALAGKKPTPEELSLVSSTNLQLLRQWEKITSTYVLLNTN